MTAETAKGRAQANLDAIRGRYEKLPQDDKDVAARVFLATFLTAAEVSLEHDDRLSVGAEPLLHRLENIIKTLEDTNL